MIIVLEGRDGTGKTTIGRYLALAHGIGYLKANTYPTHNDMIDDWIVHRTLLAVGKLPRPVVLDRSIISGVCYSSYYSTLLDAVEHANLWFDGLRMAGSLVHLVHLTADEGVRAERDVTMVASERMMMWDIDAVAQAVGQHLPEGHYHALDTAKLTVQDVVAVLRERLDLRQWR